MSSNDGILISKSTFKVYHYDADSGSNYEIAKGTSLEDAVNKAEQWEQDNLCPVEYGITFAE